MATHCDDCTTGTFLASAPDVGSVVSLTSDTSAYVVRGGDAAKARAAIVLCTDIFGWELPNVRVCVEIRAGANVNRADEVSPPPPIPPPCALSPRRYHLFIIDEQARSAALGGDGRRRLCPRHYWRRRLVRGRGLRL